MTFLLYFFLTFIAVALYFLMSMPSVGYDTLIVEFVVFFVTSIIALVVNMWLQFWLPVLKTLRRKAITADWKGWKRKLISLSTERSNKRKVNNERY